MSEEEDWITSPEVLDILWNLRGFEPGDLIKITNSRESSLADTDGSIGMLGLHKRFNSLWGHNLRRGVLHFDFLKGHKYHLGFCNYWIYKESIGAWKRPKKVG